MFNLFYQEETYKKFLSISPLEEMKQTISGVKEMKQQVRNRKDNNINVTREVFATLRKAIDEREEQTIDDIKEAAYEREKALEVSHLCLNALVKVCIALLECYHLKPVATYNYHVDTLLLLKAAYGSKWEALEIEQNSINIKILQ